ncbi:MAG: hypothetical protein ALECFALPRED_010772 [Alectoria fallacina]|uniref:Uncharacterized protein n=1 Tax=Alectoria fallacina TaxID=1903189 RepID=A0A8H3PJV1_9LECA|nr:MAG: hypothetical protein ALECFALPRED_010772 [Alectoria fallacina]
MDLSSTANEEEKHRFPLMRLSADIRNVIYRHAVGYAFPSLILPRWMQGMQRWHEYTVGLPVLAASSFTNLQLSNSQVYQEASYILYQSCQFAFIIAPNHASFLDECLLLGCRTGVIQDKTYIHRVKDIVLKANWEEHKRTDTRSFLWTIWEDITVMVCDELQGFSGLQRLTLDWRVPNPHEVLEPTKHQWLPVSPYFERLQAKRPDIRIEVLAWQIIPGIIPFKYREIRRFLGP